MKLYLSGPMTNIENYNFPEFFRIAKQLRVAGHEVESPAEYDIENGWVRVEFLNPATGNWLDCCGVGCNELDRYEHRYTTTPAFDYDAALAKDCELIHECDGIVMMEGWQQSNGARKELRAAQDAKKQVFFYETNFDKNRLGLEHKPNTGLCSYRPETEPLPEPSYVDRRPEPTPGSPTPRPLRTPEQHEVMSIFYDMLAGPTGDGGKKRAAGIKPSWKVDDSHEAAMWSHINKWKHGEKADADSGAHPLVHLAWRALAIAWQETYGEEG